MTSSDSSATGAVAVLRRSERERGEAWALIGLPVGGLGAGLIRPWHGACGLLAAVLLFGSATLAPLVIDRTGPLELLGLAGWLLWVAWSPRTASL